MKKLFLMLAAAAAVVSCSKDYTIVADNGEEIGFNSFVENSTRATSATDPSYSTSGNGVALTQFNVYGTVQGTGNGVVNIFDGAEVNGSVGSTVWTCGVKQYWIEGAEYNFAAVVDATVTKDANKMPATLTPIADETMNFKDMLYDEYGPYTGLLQNNAKVNFEFAHLLAKAQFTVKSNTEGGYFYNVKNLAVTNYSTGTYTIGAATPWSVSADNAASVSFGNVLNVTTANNNQTCATQKLLIPHANDFEVSFIVEICNVGADGKANTADDVLLGTKDYTGDNAKSVSTPLVAGHVYDFNLDLKVGEEIQFTVTTNPQWASEEDVDITL